MSRRKRKKQVPRPIHGRVIAITGGARGIGRSTAQHLISRGAKVSIGDIEVGLAQKTADELGHGTIALPLDVTDRESFASYLDETEDQLGPVDVVINNAGIMPIGPFTEETDEATKRQLDINVLGVIYGSRLALERMLPRNSGHVVNIASQAGTTGFPGLATYCASKFAVIGLSQAIYWELEDSAVEIAVVMPAIVNTELSGGMEKSRLVKSVEPEDVAEAIAEALEFPGKSPAVSVPKEAATVARFANLLPFAGQRALFKIAGGHKLAAQAHQGERAAYEQRVATKPPAALESGPGPEAAILPAGERETVER